MFGLSEEVISELHGIFRKYPGIETVIIFGSRAKGGYSTGSDIDLAIQGNKVSRELLKAVSLDIDRLGLLYKVDIVDYNQEKNTPLGRHIDRAGKVFYD